MYEETEPAAQTVEAIVQSANAGFHSMDGVQQNAIRSALGNARNSTTGPATAFEEPTVLAQAPDAEAKGRVAWPAEPKGLDFYSELAGLGNDPFGDVRDPPFKG